MDHSKINNNPRLLKWLCIGSASFGILWLAMYVVLVIYALSGNIPSGLFPEIVLEYMNAGYGFMAGEILLSGIGLVSIWMMWQGMINGFIIYAICKTSIYFMPIIFIGSSHLLFPSLILTSVCIVLYGIVFTNQKK